MPSAHASVETENASKYVAQLCKHFGHKIDVYYADDNAECRFPFGSATLMARENEFVVNVEAAEQDNLLRLKKVIEDHLLRFAFRENLPSLSWSA
ncbi:MAG: DUF2218 domain-containing protein [Mesorhizobium sp.]